MVLPAVIDCWSFDLSSHVRFFIWTVVHFSKIVPDLTGARNDSCAHLNFGLFDCLVFDDIEVFAIATLLSSIILAFTFSL